MNEILGLLLLLDKLKVTSELREMFELNSGAYSRWMSYTMRHK